MEQSKNWIKNYNELATSELRTDALAIMNAGYSAIDTESVINHKVRIDGDHLRVDERQYNLTDYESVHVIGFGKASCKAAAAIEKILGDRISDGVVVSRALATCEIIQTMEGTHPLPSQANIDASRKINELASGVGENDLVIVIVSGGGSALLCWPDSECDQGTRLYEKFLETGGTIQEMNTVRKHISLLKGGGLAKVLFPAQVVSLIFSDVPGYDPSVIASGPTYYDQTTVADAQGIIDKYQLGEFDLLETPKDQTFFEKVDNIVIVSNDDALQAMQSVAQDLGYQSSIYSNELRDQSETVGASLLSSLEPGGCVLAGGEPRFIVSDTEGRGGRNTHTALAAYAAVGPDQLFAAIASDGRDNSDVAGGIVDQETKDKATRAKTDPGNCVIGCQSLDFFEATGDVVLTGATEANVADLFIALQAKK